MTSWSRRSAVGNRRRPHWIRRSSAAMICYASSNGPIASRFRGAGPSWMGSPSPPRAKPSAAHLAAALGNQTRGALIAHIIPQPAHRHGEAVAHPNQEIDVGHAPDPPGEGAAQLEAAEIDDGLPLADLRQA